MDRRTVLAGAAAAALPRRFRPQSPARLVVDGLDTSNINDEYLGLLRTGGVHCVHKTVYREDSFEAIRRFAADRPDRATIAGSVGEIRAAKAAGRISLVLGVQAAAGMYGNGLDLAMEEAPLGSLAALRPALERYRALGLRIQGLCYNTYNVFGSGCLDHAAPLTRAGRRLVEEIHRAKIVLDVGGHAGERTSLDAVAMSAGVPIAVTHTNFAALNPNARCISDRLAEAVARTGGVIGLTAVSDFVARNPASAKRDGPTTPTASIEALLNHFDHGKRLVGAAHLALGPDFRWGQGTTEVDPTDTVTFTPEMLSAGPIRDVVGFEDIGRLPALVRGLEQRGWTASDLDLVLGANCLRVWERVWGA
jgi:membrane dipeptidase